MSLVRLLVCLMLSKRVFHFCPVVISSVACLVVVLKNDANGAGGGSGVAVYEPTGSFREMIEIPHPMCTSVCFGGKDLTDLYIVSGSDGLEGDTRGGVFRIRTPVAGLAVPLARVPV